MQIPEYLDGNPMLGVFQIHIFASFVSRIPAFSCSLVHLCRIGRNVGVLPVCQSSPVRFFSLFNNPWLLESTVSPHAGYLHSNPFKVTVPSSFIISVGFVVGSSYFLNFGYLQPHAPPTPLPHFHLCKNLFTPGNSLPPCFQMTCSATLVHLRASPPCPPWSLSPFRVRIHIPSSIDKPEMIQWGSGRTGNVCLSGPVSHHSVSSILVPSIFLQIPLRYFSLHLNKSLLCQCITQPVPIHQVMGI